MLKPSLTEMTNWTAMNEGVKQQRTTGYLITQDIITDTKECFTTPVGGDATIR
jgi:hypothetical protein